MKTEVNYISKEKNPVTEKMLDQAFAIVAGKNCITNGNGNKHRCLSKMVANIGHNEYTTNISLIGKDGGVEAYFIDGRFVTSITKREIELV
jgi:hypothetical protein